MPPKKSKSPSTSTSISTPHTGSDGEEQLSAYEQIRLDHIRRNHEFLRALGLLPESVPKVSDSDNKVTKNKIKNRVVAPSMPLELRTTRRSPRIQKEKPSYTGEFIDSFGDSSLATQKRKFKCINTLNNVNNNDKERDDDEEEEEEDIDYEEMKNSVRVAAMRHMEVVRKALLSTTISDEETATEDSWRQEAVRRWGAAVGQVHVTEDDNGRAKPRDWKVYVKSRLSIPPPVSPLDFLQEYYAADTWRLLVSCILMSRVSSLDTKHKCISAFFALYPTPSAFLIETDWSRVKDAIHSLGLFDDRLKSLIALTTRFLNAPVFNVSPDPKSEDKIRGIGAFGYESYLVFCRDEGASIKLSDGGRPLVPFVAWRKRIAKTCE